MAACVNDASSGHAGATIVGWDKRSALFFSLLFRSACSPAVGTQFPRSAGASGWAQNPDAQTPQPQWRTVFGAFPGGMSKSNMVRRRVFNRDLLRRPYGRGFHCAGLASRTHQALQLSVLLCRSSPMVHWPACTDRHFQGRKPEATGSLLGCCTIAKQR